MDLLVIPFNSEYSLPGQPDVKTLRPTAATAAQQVLELPELLETILLHLPPKDLLLSQRVNSHFRDATTTSPKLQRALFLQPDPKLPAPPYSSKRTAAYPSSHPGRKPENNSLLLRAFPGNYPTVTLVIVNEPPTATDMELSRQGAESWSWDVCISFPANSSAEKLPPSPSNPAVNYPEASWRRMYLCQPPCTSLHLVRRYQRSAHPAIVREKGITMGDCVSEATKKQSKWHQSYISSDRDWHFEGNIKCSKVEDGTSWQSLPEEFTGYLYSRTARNGAVRALSDDWDTAEFARARAVLS